MADESKTVLVVVATGERLGSVAGSRGDLEFPEQVRGWADVLDCRHGRYLKMELDEIRHIAEHVHKHYIVLNEDQL